MPPAVTHSPHTIKSCNCLVLKTNPSGRSTTMGSLPHQPAGSTVFAATATQLGAYARTPRRHPQMQSLWACHIQDQIVNHQQVSNSVIQSAYLRATQCNNGELQMCGDMATSRYSRR